MNINGTNGNSLNGTEPFYGVRDWVDRHGNHGTELVSQRHIKVHTIRANGVFEPDHQTSQTTLVDYFKPEGDLMRKILVVIDSDLPTSRQRQIETYFKWCKSEKLLEDYIILPLSVASTDKTLEAVSTVIKQAKTFRLKRRDLFLAIGGTNVTDVVGFTAATYRRSAPWILVSTDISGIVHCSACDTKLSIDHVGHDGTKHRAAFQLSHPPLASFYDPSFLVSPSRDNLRRGLAEIIKVSLYTDAELFSYVESRMEKLLAGPKQASYLIDTSEMAARAASYRAQLYEDNFGDSVMDAVEQIRGIKFDDADSISLGVAMASALSFMKGFMRGTDLERILNLLLKAGLSIFDETLSENGSFQRVAMAIHQRSGFALNVPIAIGQLGPLKLSHFSPEEIDAAVLVLRKHLPEGFRHCVCAEGFHDCYDIDQKTLNAGNNIMCHVEDILDHPEILPDNFLEREASEDTQYHVATVPEIFNAHNKTLVQGYCLDGSTTRTRKILVVVDDYEGCPLDAISTYFATCQSEIGEYSVLPLHVSSHDKDLIAVCKVVDAAIKLGISRSDLFIVVGGGTLMDIVGFAASIFRGGVPYLRIATTLVGMIDAGIGVKTGVNFENHKSLVGRYYAPVACLNDPITFLATLPRREFACGLAESIKMAILKSSRLFELIEEYHHVELGYNSSTPELIYLSIRTMLEELQPNLHEHDLRRLVDFGHEFGHIVESQADHKIPHGECVSIGIGISSSLAYRLGILGRSDLEQILNCFLGLGLPIHATDYGCCDPDVLWAKISTEGIEHKDGMLWLAVSETIGRGAFINNITDIDAQMVHDALLGLKLYQDQYHKESDSEGDSGVGMIESIMQDDADAKKGHYFYPNGSKSCLVNTESQSQPVSILCLHHHIPFKQSGAEDLPAVKITLKFIHSGTGFNLHYGSTQNAAYLEKSLDRWFDQLTIPQQRLLTAYMHSKEGLVVQLRSDSAIGGQIGAFTIERDGPTDWQGYIDIHAGLSLDSQEVDEAIGYAGHHLLSFLSRGRTPLCTRREQELEQAAAVKWKEFLRPWISPHVIVLDVGSTNIRVALIGPHGQLIGEPSRIPSPGMNSKCTLTVRQEALMDTLSNEVNSLRARHPELAIDEVGVGFGAVVDRDGVVQDASILWNCSAKGYEFKHRLMERLPGMNITVINDVSAAAWRYKDEGRFCLITVSSGLSNKVFNPDLGTLDHLDLDAAGLGGEMGHVVVEPRAVDALVQDVITQAVSYPEKFRDSKLYDHVQGDARKINARNLGVAAMESDKFALDLLYEADVPLCQCGNLADLCSYSSGRGALRLAQRLATNDKYGVSSKDVDDKWLKEGIASGHPLALKVLSDATYPLAHRILQLAADLGLEKFIIMGGFPLKTGSGRYLQTLQDHLVRLYHPTAFFSQWSESRIRGLVRLGIDDDNDGLVGMGHFVHHSRRHFLAVEKPIGEQSLVLATRSIPRCGDEEILTKVVYSAVCTTDLQILRGERQQEPVVLGHEGVLQVIEVGRNVTGLKVGEMVVLNPNNPLDDHEKLGHNREGLFQEYFKFGQESVHRQQVLNLGRKTASAVDVLIEPLSGVVAAQDRLGNRVSGKNALVVGAGRMGLLFCSMLTIMGASKVFLANRSQGKLDFAVSRGIIQRDRAFVADNDQIFHNVDQVTSGEGVDIVVICVSRGQGVNAAQLAMNYVNAGGCVYLFAGFSSGDILSLDGGSNIDAWSIRTGWRTEQVKVAGKPIYLSGHRGCRNEHLAAAANIIHANGMIFSRMISHIISITALPDVVTRLARDGAIQDVAAKTVIVDMTARGNSVESPEEFPLRHLKEAAGKPKYAVSMGNVFRDIGFDRDTPSLGWVHPPTWQEIKATVESTLQMKPLKSKKHFIWVGTGAWTFLVDALKDTLPSSQHSSFYTLSSVDPQALVDIFGDVEDLSAAICIGISQSGTTMETVMLMSMLRERFDSAGLDYREHFVWLTDLYNSEADNSSGETVIRSLHQNDWTEVTILPLTVANHSDINALFCAPHSTVMFLALALLLGPDFEVVLDSYTQYLASRDTAVKSILPKAYSAALKSSEYIQVILDQDIAGAMVRLITQLIEQALGSKVAGFNPRVRVTSEKSGSLDGFELLPIAMPTDIPVVTKVMLTMHALSVFVAMVGYHRNIQFVTHPKVGLYKRRVLDLIAASKVKRNDMISELLITDIISHLKERPRVRFVDVLCYGHTLASYRQSLRDWLASSLASRGVATSISVLRGEEWNHSSYQAAVQAEETLFVILVSHKPCSQVQGVSPETLESSSAMLQAIAQATYETLAPKSLYFPNWQRSFYTVG